MVRLLDKTLGGLTSLGPKAPQLGEAGYREARLEAARCIANMCQRPTTAQQNWNILKNSKEKLSGIWGAAKAAATASNRSGQCIYLCALLLARNVPKYRLFLDSPKT